MLTQYIQAAMRKATYEILNDRSYYGEIPGFQGLFANAPTLDGCREQLQEVLEDWIVLGLRLSHKLPVVVGSPVAKIIGHGNTEARKKLFKKFSVFPCFRG